MATRLAQALPRCGVRRPSARGLARAAVARQSRVQQGSGRAARGTRVSAVKPPALCMLFAPLTRRRCAQASAGRALAPRHAQPRALLQAAPPAADTTSWAWPTWSEEEAAGVSTAPAPPGPMPAVTQGTDGDAALAAAQPAPVDWSDDDDAASASASPSDAAAGEVAQTEPSLSAPQQAQLSALTQTAQAQAPAAAQQAAAAEAQPGAAAEAMELILGGTRLLTPDALAQMLFA